MAVTRTGRQLRTPRSRCRAWRWMRRRPGRAVLLSAFVIALLSAVGLGGFLLARWPDFTRGREHQARELLEQAQSRLRTELEAASDERARQIFFDGEMPDFQVVIPDFGIVEGACQITAIEYAGTHDGEATYEMSMASAGELTFTAL